MNESGKPPLKTLLADWTFRFKRRLVGRQKVRRTQVYCVGSAKSGTHSIRSMFSGNVCAGHEPQALQLIEKFFEWHNRRISDQEMTNWILERDRDLALEVDSSWFNVLIHDFLAREFPGARFVLTIRDCYSWLNSEFKRVLHAPTGLSQRIRLREFLYDRENAVYAPEEQILRETGLFPLDNYLSRWSAHNEAVLNTIAAERLLIVRTDQIRARAYEIADFAGLPRHAVRLQRTHEYRNPVEREIIREIDRSFLEEKIERHCRPLMARFFPEITSLRDAK
ncbi:MAG TPA: sulfotransferase, partial [Verrucomicrobiae bacterium]|nr:sulfotransferase [Verrucomicrobiae bacterium]